MKRSKRSHYYRRKSRSDESALYHLASRTNLVRNMGWHSKDYEDRFRICESGFTKGQGWGGLYKAWQGYLINRAQNNMEGMQYYAQGIRRIEKDMKIDLSNFPDLRMEALEYANNPENEQFLEEEASKQNKDVDELSSSDILNVMLAQDERVFNAL